MRGLCPREENFGDFTLKMAIPSSFHGFQAQGNRAAGMNIEIFGFAGSPDGSVCELFPAQTLSKFAGPVRETVSGNCAVQTGRLLPTPAQARVCATDQAPALVP